MNFFLQPNTMEVILKYVDNQIVDVPKSMTSIVGQKKYYESQCGTSTLWLQKNILFFVQQVWNKLRVSK